MTTHNAPPVIYPVGRSHFQGRLMVGLCLGGLLLSVFWFAAARQVDWRLALAAGAVLLAAAAAWAGWRGMPTGQLAWDGQVWRWESPGYQAGSADYQLSVVADFQHRLVLRLQNPDGASLWLWPERQAFPERWLALRRAVYSPNRSAGNPHQQDSLDAEPRPAVAGWGLLAPSADAQVPLP